MTSKFERDKVYKTRDGREARVICVDAPEPLPIVALTIKERPYSLWRVGADGRGDEDTNNSFDLTPPKPKPKPVVEWGVMGVIGHSDFLLLPSEDSARTASVRYGYTVNVAKRTTEIVE